MKICGDCNILLENLIELGWIMIKICAIERRIIDNCPIPAGIKCKYSKYVYVNQHYADSIGIEKHTDVIGLTSKDLPSTSSRCADKFDEQDLMVMRSGKHLTAYCVYKINGDSKIRVCRYIKYPYKDIDGKIKGVFFSTENITHKFVTNIGAILFHKNKDSADGTVMKVSALSKKLQDVLFYVNLGKSSKEIAIAMNVAERTANSYIDKLKEILGVYNKSDLASICIGAQIPSALLDEDIALVVNDYLS